MTNARDVHRRGHLGSGHAALRGADQHHPGALVVALDGLLDRAHDLAGVRRVVAADEPQPAGRCRRGRAGRRCSGPRAIRRTSTLAGDSASVAISSSRLRGARGRGDLARAASSGAGATNPPATSRSGRAEVGVQRRQAHRPQPAPRGQPAGLAGQHAGGQQRAHLQAVEQPAATAGDVVHQLGVVLGQLVEVRRDAVAVERVGLDQARRRRSRRRARPRARGSRWRGRRWSRGSCTRRPAARRSSGRSARSRAPSARRRRARSPRVSRPCLPVVARADVVLGLGVGQLRQLGGRRSPRRRGGSRSPSRARVRSSSPDRSNRSASRSIRSYLSLEVGCLGGGGRHPGRLAGGQLVGTQRSLGHAVTSARTGASSVARSEGSTRLTCTRCIRRRCVAAGRTSRRRAAPTTPRRPRWSRRRTRRRPAPAAGPATRARSARSTALTSSSVSGRPSRVEHVARVLRGEHRDQVGAAAAGRLGGGVGELEGEVDERRDRRGAHRAGPRAARRPGPARRATGRCGTRPARRRPRRRWTAWPRRRRTDGARSGRGRRAAATSMSTAVRGVASSPTAPTRPSLSTSAVRAARGARARPPGRAGTPTASAYAASSATSRLSPSRPSSACAPAGLGRGRTAAGRRRRARRPAAARPGSAPPGAAARRAARWAGAGGAEIDRRHVRGPAGSRSASPCVRTAAV